jgi:hypothetical protein
MADRILLLRSLVAEAQRESRAQIQVTRKTLDLSREGIASTRALIEKAKQTIEQSRVHLAPNKSVDVRNEIAPELTGHGLPLSKCEAYNRVYDQFYQSR